MSNLVHWFIDMTYEEELQFRALSMLLEVDIHKHETLAEFLDACRLNILDLLDEKSKIAELQDFAIWMTGCGYDFAALPYFCEQRDKLLK